MMLLRLLLRALKYLAVLFLILDYSGLNWWGVGLVFIVGMMVGGNIAHGST